MCGERTKHLWHKYHGFFFNMNITSQRSYLSQINTRQTSFEACFDSKRKSRDSSAPLSVTVIYKKRNIYCIERHLKKLFTIIITGE